MQRREFLKYGALTGLGLYFLPGMAQKVAASDRVRIALVGLGWMGTEHLKWFAALPDVEIVALCDLDKDHLDKQPLTGIVPDEWNDFENSTAQVFYISASNAKFSTIRKIVSNINPDFILDRSISAAALSKEARPFRLEQRSDVPAS